MQLHIYRCKSKEELLAQIKKNFSYVSFIFDKALGKLYPPSWWWPVQYLTNNLNHLLLIYKSIIISAADSREKRRRGLYPL